MMMIIIIIIVAMVGNKAMNHGNSSQGTTNIATKLLTTHISYAMLCCDSWSYDDNYLLIYTIVL